MALFKIHKGDSANLDAQSRVEGYCWFTPDTGHFFIDTADARVPINATMYGVCNTAADTATKTVDITGFRLYTGARVTVKFTYASGASNSTLNVNGTGAKNMVRYGTTAIGNSSTLGWAAGAIQTFTYDGTSWVADYWQNTTYSNVALGQGYATCSTAAATAAKTASLSSYSLTKGGIVAVKFTYAVPANATLNINSKGAKNIYYRGAKIIAGIIDAGDTAVFMYDGTQYQFLAKDYNNATTTTAGLMSAADKINLNAHQTRYLGNFATQTIANLRSSLEEWSTSVITYPGATANFTAAISWPDLWNAENLTSTIGEGPTWLVTLQTYYVRNDYLLLKVVSYYENKVYYIARENKVWKPIHEVFFDNSVLTADQLPASGVTAGTYGPEAAATPEHGGKILVPKIVVDDKGRITSAATQEITLPADTNTDTKNTAGSTNTSNKIFLIGATSQATNPQTYSHDTVYVDADGNLNTSKLIVNTTDTPGIIMNRGSYNYIQGGDNAPICLIANNTMGLANASLVAAKTAVHPGKNNTFDLGSSTYKWKNVYATTYHGGTATTAAEGLMSAADKTKVDAALVLQSTRITDSISLDDTTLAAGIYVVDGFTLDDVKYYGTFIQYGGSYHTQVLYVSPSGAQGKMVIYTRRYVSGSSSWSPWIKIDGLEATISITDAEIDAICTSTLEVDSTLVDEVTGTSYRLYVSEGNLKMAEVNK